MPGGREERPSPDHSSKEHGGRDQGEPSTGRTNSKTAPAEPQGGLLQALDEYRSGHKELDQAAAEAGVTSWDLLEAVQATPDPMADGLDEPSGLQPFIRRRED